MTDEEFNQLTDSMIEQITGDEYIISKPYSAYSKENQEYSAYVYDGGTYFLCELRKAMGDEVFYPMLQEYYKAYHFNEVSTEEFVEVIRTFDNSESVRRIVEKYIQ